MVEEDELGAEVEAGFRLTFVKNFSAGAELRGRGHTAMVLGSVPTLRDRSGGEPVFVLAII